MLGAAVSGAGPQAFREDREAEKRADHDATVDAAHAVTPDESAWLKERLDSDAALDPLEQALLDFIAEEQRAA